MHFVLRSSKAKGDWSFLKLRNKIKIEEILNKFSRKNGVRIISQANVGNHLHLHLKLMKRRKLFRLHTGCNRRYSAGRSKRKREILGSSPLSRVVRGWRDFLNVKKYVEVNQLESYGVSREEAKQIVSGRALGLEGLARRMPKA